MTQRLKQRSNGKRRGDYDKWRLPHLSRHSIHQVLQEHHTAKIDQGKDSCEGAIDQSTIDYAINIPQPVAKDGNADREGKQEQQDRIGEVKNPVIWDIGLIECWEKAIKNERKHNKSCEHADDAKDYPLGLLTLYMSGDTSVAIDLRKDDGSIVDERNQHVEPPWPIIRIERQVWRED